MDRLTQFEQWWESQSPGMKNPASKSSCERGWNAALSALADREKDWVRVPREFLERVMPALKLSYLKASQSVNACARGEMPSYYMEALKTEEEMQAELLEQLRAMLPAAPKG